MAENQNALSDKERYRLAYILISRFVALYREVHGTRPTVNRYAAKWGMVDVIDSIGAERAGVVLEYYFKLNAKHSLDFFYKNFDKLDNNLTIITADKKRRAKMLRETKQRVEENRN
jgi:hypothetical protein